MLCDLHHSYHVPLQQAERYGDAGRLRIGEEAERNLPVGGGAMAARDVVVNDMEIFLADVRVLRAAASCKARRFDGLDQHGTRKMSETSRA